MPEAEAQSDDAALSRTQADRDRRKRGKACVVVEHVDIIKDDFWDRRPWLLSNRPGKVPKEP